MTYCSIKWCGKNSRSSKYKTDGITFHRFPTQHILKENWIKLTRRENWFPTKYSVVCSRHFTEDCFVTMKNCRRRLLDTAVPTLSIPILADEASTSESEASNAIKFISDTLPALSSPGSPKSRKKQLNAVQLEMQFESPVKKQLCQRVIESSNEPKTQIKKKIIQQTTTANTHRNASLSSAIGLSLPSSSTPATSKITKRKMVLDSPSQFESPIKKRLGRQVTMLSNKMAQRNTLIKKLREKVRYYKKRVASLKTILKELVHHSTLDKDRKQSL